MKKSPRFAWCVIQPALLGLGVVLLLYFLYQIGPLRIYNSAATVGLWGMILMLVPSAAMYLLDCVRWRATLTVHASAVPFLQIFMIRMACEVVNAITPTGSVGGKPLKAYLLKRYRIRMGDSLMAIILAKRDGG